MSWANLLAVFVVAVVTVILLKVLKPLIWLRYILYLSYMGISNVHGSQFRDFFPQNIQQYLQDDGAKRSEHLEWTNLLLL